MLSLVPTPLGHLKDITLRALETLQACDLILCEDTRHSKTLLDHYNIQTPLKSLHKFNEKEQLEELLDLLRAQKHLALISDAGTPCIQDPGAILVKACYEHQIPVVSLPGPCAFVTAMAASGEEEGPFQFIGFFPKKEEAAKKMLAFVLNYEGHTLAYVPPHQLLDLLTLLKVVAPSRKLFLMREITKYYEESYQGSADELCKHFNMHAPKGEFVMMIKKEEEPTNFEHLSIQEHVALLETTYHLSKKEAIKLAAQQRNIPKRDVYNLFHKESP